MSKSKDSDLYVITCTSNRGVAGGVPYHFGKGGRCGLYVRAIGVC